MPTPISVANTAFREVSVQETKNRGGMDSVSIRLRGAASALAAAKATYRRAGRYGSYRTMGIETIDSTESGPVAEINITILGFIDTIDSQNGVVSITDDISAQSVTINTDDDENITFNYFAQKTSVRYISRTEQSPRNTKYPGIVPSAIPTDTLFQPNPPKYTGSISGRYKLVGRLISFQRERIADNVWAVAETWSNLIEPVQEVGT
jgi:hypothetical protein